MANPATPPSKTSCVTHCVGCRLFCLYASALGSSLLLGPDILYVILMFSKIMSQIVILQLKTNSYLTQKSSFEDLFKCLLVGNDYRN